MSYCSDLPIPTPQKKEQLCSNENSSREQDVATDPDFRVATEKRNPYYRNSKRHKPAGQIAWSHKVQYRSFDINTQAVLFVR